MTNYDQITHQYQAWQDTPLWNYSEPYTLLTLVGDVSGRSCLDVACGTGPYARFLRKAGGDPVVGVDLSKTQILRAREIEQNRPLGVRYMVGDAKTIQLDPFNVVVASHLLGYAKNRTELHEMCDRLSKVTQRGGRLTLLHRTYEASPRNRQSLHEAYQVRVTLGKDQEDGCEADVELLLEGGPVKLRNMLWKQSVVKNALTRAGFVKIEYHTMKVSPEGITALGARYWQEYLSNPGTGAVTAIRG